MEFRHIGTFKLRDLIARLAHVEADLQTRVDERGKAMKRRISASVIPDSVHKRLVSLLDEHRRRRRAAEAELRTRSNGGPAAPQWRWRSGETRPATT